MTDTPRTRDELLTDIFPDGQFRGISAQDMRDFVVSVYPQPAATSFVWQQTKDPLDGVYDLYGDGSELGTVDPAVVSPIFDMTQHAGALSYGFYDGGGWLVDDVVESSDFWGADFPANTVLQLPAGVFMYEITYNIAGTVGTGNLIRAALFMAEDTMLSSVIAQGFGSYDGNQGSYGNYTTLQTYARTWAGYVTLDVPTKVIPMPVVGFGSVAASVRFVQARLAVTKVA